MCQIDICRCHPGNRIITVTFTLTLMPALIPLQLMDPCYQIYVCQRDTHISMQCATEMSMASVEPQMHDVRM